ncbi:cbb3-type cytochrome c oxidase subunit 3 [Tateyamaria armeniaca]|uniref:Cbb3-type cytochrome c oxidase subunit 3 n=1 Tax=Tateyamaria armeniaca TaxID=2518930 RepID=A0ABW8UYM1_9RHOB
MDTYSFLRELADSWVLLAMMVFYIIACLWAFRPGARPANEEAAGIPFRNDGEADPKSQEVEAK